MKKSCFLQTIGICLLLSILLTTPTFASSNTDWSQVFFLGESTTAHLRLRGNDLGQYAKTNVLATDSGTLSLTSRILSQNIRNPKSKVKQNLAQVIIKEQPPILVLSFGLNGILGFVAKKENYTMPYQLLIRQIHALSPNTKIVLQTIYPVAEKPLDWKFSTSPAQINRHIQTLNGWLFELAESEGVLLADTASTLYDPSGFLKADFSSDGVHLSSAGYETVLEYLASYLEGHLT